MSAPRKHKVVTMLVTVPRIDGLTAAEHRKSVRDALRQTGDFYQRKVGVRAIASWRAK